MRLLIFLLSVVLISGCRAASKTNFEKAAEAIEADNRIELARLLQADKSLVSQEASYDGCTLLDLAMVNVPKIECAKLLISNGADVNKPNGEGKAPLHWLCDSTAQPKAILLLLEKGAKFNVRDKGGHTPLYYAKRRSRSIDGIKILVDRGAIE
jgi:ankyrin repeat protein